ncbi:replication-relaxation family protein [Actinomadura sp. NPDC048394]|uniref:replication-relaxation family protein n=1 Tax=Actinomadura sp. NPDC048394 TaxID=3158223 RepID=UPI0033DCE7FF
MTRRHTTDTRLRGSQARAPRLSADVIADLVYRLTVRDRDLLALVWEHRVLTTGQLTRLFFPTPERARQRLNHLHRHHALLRFRPWTPVGSKPWHWVLGPAGAHVLAVEQGRSITEFGYRQDTATAIAVSPRLAHQVGVNEFFVALHVCARRQGGAVEQWWPEYRCAALWGDLAHPDAFGRWTKRRPDGSSSTLDFFLEHDTGTETLARVIAKLGGYADLAEATGTTTPVLFWLPSAKREANLRRLLGTPEIPVATAVHTPATSPDGPAGPVWQPAGATGPRHSLSDLAQLWATMPRHDHDRENADDSVDP